MTTSWLICPLRHVRYSGDNVKTHHKPSNCCWCRCRCIIIRLWCNDCRNPQFGWAVLLISFMEVVGRILPSWMCQFVKLHLLLLKPLHALLHHFGECAHHPAGFVILAQLALLCLFIILIIPILLIVGTCKITQTVSDSNHHLLESLFGLSVGQSSVFSFPCIIVLLLNCCVWAFYWHCCPSSLSIYKILDPLFFLIIAQEVCFLSFLGSKLLFGSQAAQFRKGSESLRFQAAFAFIPLLTSLCRPLCWFAIFACRKLRKVQFRSIDLCSLHWLCRWARCWMLQEKDSMEAICVFYVKVCVFNHPEQS